MRNLPSWNPHLAERLNYYSIPPLTDPFRARVFWFKAYSSEDLDSPLAGENHSHAFHELHYILNGSVLYDFPGREPVRLDEMHLILIPPYTPHQIMEEQGKVLRFVVGLEFSDSYTDGTLRELYRSLSIAEPFIGKVNDRILPAFAHAIEEMKAPSVLTGYLLRNDVFQLLCDVLRQLKSNVTTSGIGGMEDARIALAKRFILTNLSNRFTSGDVAEAAGISTRQLERLFLRSEYCTLTEYVHRFKIGKAKHLLNTTKLTLHEISEQLGFSSEYYFNSFFKTHTGITPGNYRKSSRL